MDPDTAHPCAQVDHAHDEDAPLVSFPCGVEPGRLAEHAEDAGPATQLLAAGLGQPGCKGSEQGDGDLVEFHAVIVHDWMELQPNNWTELCNFRAPLHRRPLPLRVLGFEGITAMRVCSARAEGAPPSFEFDVGAASTIARGWTEHRREMDCS